MSPAQKASWFNHSEMKFPNPILAGLSPGTNSWGVLSIACAVPCFDLLFFFSCVSFNF